MNVAYSREEMISTTDMLKNFAKTLEKVSTHKIEKIAIISIPLNVPFWIVEDELIPTDREYRNAWELDLDTIGEPSGYGGQE